MARKIGSPEVHFPTPQEIFPDAPAVKIRNKVTYDVSETAKETVTFLAQRHDVPKGQMAELLMILGAQIVKDGFDIEDLVVRSWRSPRTNHELNLPDFPSVIP